MFFLHWPEEIMADLVSTKNTQGRITSYNIDLVALVLQEATFPFSSTNPTWRSPFTGSDNTPTVAWTFQEAFTVKPVVVDLLRLQSVLNCQFKITPSVFYHSGTQNTMAGDAYKKFHLSSEIFISLFSRTYSPQQSPGMWHA